MAARWRKVGTDKRRVAVGCGPGCGIPRRCARRGRIRTISRVRTSPLAVAAAIAAVATRVLPLPVGVVRSTLLPSTSSMMASSCASYSSMFFVSVAQSRMHSNIASALSSSSAITARVSDPGLTPASSMASCFSGNSTSAAAPATKRARRETRDVAGECLDARPTRSSRCTTRGVPTGATIDRGATAVILPVSRVLPAITDPN